MKIYSNTLIALFLILLVSKSSLSQHSKLIDHIKELNSSDSSKEYIINTISRVYSDSPKDIKTPIAFNNVVHTTSTSDYRLIGASVNDGGALFSFDPSNNSFELLKKMKLNQEPSNSALIVSSGKFWGLTVRGGSLNMGLIYSMNIDGSGYEVVYEFDGTNGKFPFGGLIEFDSKLWGTTTKGGDNDLGIVFKLNLDGTEFEAIHHFETDSGFEPRSGLIVNGDQLIGVATKGGNLFGGVLYTINPANNMYEVIHSFETSSRPYNKPTLINGKIWGTTLNGGGEFGGTVYSINPDGSEFSNHQVFSTVNRRGYNPWGSLIVADQKIWGINNQGGVRSAGYIYSIDLNGQNYTEVHDFNTGNSSEGGALPRGSLIFFNDEIWGTTIKGGTYDQGTIFKIGTNGSNFQKVYDFGSAPGEGRNPWCNLILEGDKIFGTTVTGGSFGDGTIFSINAAGDHSEIHDFSDSQSDGFDPSSNIIEAYGRLWGTTTLGGKNDFGVIFSMKKDGTDYTVHFDFDDNNGKNPSTNLIQWNRKLWGVTKYGGENDMGVLFNIGHDGKGFQKLYDFSTNGENPNGALVVFDEKLWGITQSGGSNGFGVIYNWDPTNAMYTKVWDFDIESRDGPVGALLEVDDLLYGVTRPGVVSRGGIFSFDPANSAYNEIFSFDSSTGRFPYDGLIEYEDKLWGTLATNAAIFSINLDGMSFSRIYEFPILNGPRGRLLPFDGKLWGLMNFPEGKIFQINPDGSGFTNFDLVLDGVSQGASTGGGLSSIMLIDNPIILGTIEDIVRTEGTPIEVSIDNLIIEYPVDALPDDFSIELENGANYSLNGNTIMPDDNFTGLLTVGIRVSDGEKVSELFELKVEVIPVAILDLERNSDFLTIYPNPTKGELHLNLSNKLYDDVNVVLINMTGSHVMEQVWIKLEQSFEKRINIEGLPKGMYLLKINQSDFQTTKKISLF